MNSAHHTLTVRRAQLADASLIASLVREAALSDKIDQVPQPDLVARIQQGIQTCLDGKGATI
ncbi:MAG: hypothetical protein PVH26_13280, partial [Desulfosarcina sp.]